MKKAFCARCAGERNCEILGHHIEKKTDSLESYFWQTDWRILQCRGCEYVFVQTISIHSEDYDYANSSNPELDGTVEYNETIDFWPSLSKRHKPAWLDSLPLLKIEGIGRLSEALNEAYGALDAGLYTLGSIGIRTSFDIAAELLKIEESLPFKGKLDALVHEGHIGKVDLDRIEILVEAGSASAHRGWHPTPNDLSVIMEVLEHFLQEAFVAPESRKLLDEKARKVRSRVPARKARNQSNQHLARKNDIVVVQPSNLA